MKKLYFLFTFIFVLSLYAQVGIGTNTPNEKAILDLSSTTKGLLLPRLTDTQLTAMGTNLPEGLMVYNMDTNKFLGWNGNAWWELNTIPVTNTIVEFTATSSTVTENVGTLSLNLSISNPSGSSPTTVEVGITGGTANALDINNYTTQTVSWAAGDSSNKTVTITVTDDLLAESTENLIFSLSNISGGVNAAIGTNNMYTLSITDNDVLAVPNLIISEYIEGSGSNKYIEIFNIGSAPATLSEYQIALFANGNSSANANITMSDFQPTLNAGESIILKNFSAALTLPSTAVNVHNSGVCNFSGDDALTLSKNGILIDVFGEVGTDPGSSWSVAGDGSAGVNKGIRRKTSINNGNTNWTNSSGTNATDSEWVIINTTDDVSHLGVR